MKIFAGWHDDPVAIPSDTPTRIATLAIPEPGFYAVTAKATLSLGSATSAEYVVSSRLQAEDGEFRDWDQAATTVRANNNSVRHSLFLQVVHQFRAPGHVWLQCVLTPASSLPGEARDIKIVATQHSSMVNRPI